MFGLSFLTTLNIISIVLRAITADAVQCKSFSQTYCELKTYTLVHLSLEKGAVFVHRRVL